MVGTEQTIELAEAYFAEAGDGYEGKSEKHPNMHPEFPGLGNRNPFRCKFDIQPGAKASLTNAQLERILKEPDHTKAVEMAVDEVMKCLQTLADGSNKPDVAMIAMPVKLIERVWNAKTDAKSSTETDDAGGSNAPDFRGLLKARAMGFSFPIQIVWEDVINDKAKIPRKIKESSDRRIQDKAGRSWNLLTTLYYKGSGRVHGAVFPKRGNTNPAISGSVSTAALMASSYGRARLRCSTNAVAGSSSKVRQRKPKPGGDIPTWPSRTPTT